MRLTCWRKVLRQANASRRLRRVLDGDLQHVAVFRLLLHLRPRGARALCQVLADGAPATLAWEAIQELHEVAAGNAHQAAQCSVRHPGPGRVGVEQLPLALVRYRRRRPAPNGASRGVAGGLLLPIVVPKVEGPPTAAKFRVRSSVWSPWVVVAAVVSTYKSQVLSRNDHALPSLGGALLPDRPFALS